MKILGKELLLFLPRDFLEFIKPYNGKAFDFFFKSYNWNFWPLDEVSVRTEKLVSQGLISEADIAFASNVDGQSLFLKNDGNRLTSKLYLLDEDGEWSFYAMSICEFINFEKTQKLIKEIKRVGFENQDLTVISDCTGSLFNYAYELYSSQFDAGYSIERNQKALSLFEELSDQGHPGAAHELASHYYFEDELEVEKVINWRKKAIALGSIEDVFDLVDFILEENVGHVDHAIDLLDGLMEVKWHCKRASLKLSRIYMDPEVGNDFQRGIEYAQFSAGAGNYNALSDLAFYYFEGKGVEKDLHKAYELLVSADQKIMENAGEGLYAKEIKMFEKQLNR